MFFAGEWLVVYQCIYDCFHYWDLVKYKNILFILVYYNSVTPIDIYYLMLFKYSIPTTLCTDIVHNDLTFVYFFQTQLTFENNVFL